MALSIFPGSLPGDACKSFVDQLSGTSGWTLSDHQTTRSLSDADPIFKPAQELLQIPLDRRAHSGSRVTVAFKKFVGNFAGNNYTILIFLEGEWRVQNNKRNTNIQAGDIVISNLPLTLESTGRHSRWVFVSQSVTELGVSINMLARMLTGSEGPFITGLIDDGSPNDKDDEPEDIEPEDEDIDEDEDDMFEDEIDAGEVDLSDDDDDDEEIDLSDGEIDDLTSAFKADALAALNADALKVEADALVIEALKGETETLKAEAEALKAEAEADAFRIETETLKIENEAFKAKTDALKAEVNSDK